MAEQKNVKTPIDEESENNIESSDIDTDSLYSGAEAKETSNIKVVSEEVKEEEKEASIIEDLEKKLEDSENAVKENHDRFLRISAEFDNYKKRTTRDNEEFRKFANESLIKQMLPVIDNLERAIQMSCDHSDNSNSLLEGVELTLKEILKTFEKFHVKQLDSIEQPFDPNFHQAVMQEESDKHPENTVIKELQKGYCLHDRLIRPAMVVVSRVKSDSDNNGNK